MQSVPPGTLFQIKFEWTRNEKAAGYVIVFFFHPFSGEMAEDIDQENCCRERSALPLMSAHGITVLTPGVDWNTSASLSTFPLRFTSFGVTYLFSLYL
jgi:hypothetical protein